MSKGTVKVKRTTLELSETARTELIQVRDHHALAYLRERAAAVLKVAGGESVRQVAEYGLHKRHEPETVSEWIRRYREAGIEGLKIKPGRGRKPSFFPYERDDGAPNPAALDPT